MPHPRSPAVLVLLCVLVALGPLSTDMYLPALPELTRVFHAGVGEVQLTLSVFMAGLASAQLVYGPLSDRFGRRPVMLAGLVLFALASAACAFAPTIEALIAARFVQALGASAGPVLGRAVVRDLYEPAHAAKMLAYVGMAMGLAPAIAPTLGGFLLIWFGWAANFVLLALLAAAMVAAVMLMLSETNRHMDPHALRPGRLAANYLRLLADRRYVGYALSNACNFAGLFAFISGSSFVLIDVLGVEPQHFGLWFAVGVAGYMIGAFASGRLTMRLGIDRMVMGGTMLAAAAGIAMAVLSQATGPSIPAVMGPVFFYMMSVGIVLPNGMAGAIGPFPRMAGLASSLIGFLQMALGAAAGVLVGQLHDGTSGPMAAVICAAGIAGLLLYRTLAWPLRAQRTPEFTPSGSGGG